MSLHLSLHGFAATVLAASLMLALTGGVARPDETAGEEAGGTCDAGGVLDDSLFTDICWDCIFPIRLAGVDIGGFGRLEGEGSRRRTEAPEGASDQVGCACYDALGVPEFGLALSFWEPARLVEIVREPGCSPILEGADLPAMGSMLVGTGGTHDGSTADKGFYNYHVWAFPLLFMLELLGVERCMADGYGDLDIMYFSEVDPTWNHDELAFWTTPEIALTATLPAQLACTADAVAANTGTPIDALFWCAGSWGSLYPYVGSVIDPQGQPESMSLLSARALGAMHRRGLARRTMGSDTICEARIDPFMPKSQYEMSMLHPVPEANGRHAIGEHTFFWGEWRTIPGQGENVYLTWRWNDCCTAIIP